MQNGRLFEVPTMNEVVSRSKARKPFFFEGSNANVPIDEELIGHGHGHGD